MSHSEGETKRGPSGNTVGIDGPEPHARSTCAYPFATPCPYCVPDTEWVVLLTTEADRLREALQKIAKRAREAPMEDGLDAGNIAREALEGKFEGTP